GLEPVLHALRQARTIGGEGDLAHRLGSFGAAFDVELALVEHDVVLGRLQHVGRELLGLLDYALGGAADGHPAYREAPAAVGTVTEAGTLVGVPVPDLDLLVGHAERVRHDLGEGRLVTLAVGVGPRVDGHRAGWMDLYLGRLHQRHAGGGSGQGARPEAAELDPGRQPDAEVAALGPEIGLALAERLVTDQVHGFGEGLLV